MIGLLLALAGCGATDPDLVAARGSLDAWERGKALLEQHDAAGARAAFAEARALRDDPLLEAWEADAAAQQGDLDAAARAYEEALAKAPELAAAHYRYGVLLARRGDQAKAAEELRKAIDGGAVRAIELLDDPDLRPYLSDPAWDFVPRQALAASVDPVPPTAFWGSEVTVSVRLEGLVRPPFSVVSAPVQGPVRLVSVVEEDTADAGATGLAVRVTLEVTGAGHVTVGPWVLAVSGAQVTADAVGFDAAAPPGKEAAPPAEVTVKLPDELLEVVKPPSAALVNGRLVVAGDPSDKVALDPPSAALPVILERRGPQGATAKVWWWPPGVAPRTVRVTSHEGGTRFDGPPAGTGAER